MRILILTLIMAGLLLFTNSEIGKGNLLLRKIFDFGHFPLMAWITWVFASVIEKKAKNLLYCFVGCSLLVILIELVQPFFSRSQELCDVIYGVAGVFFAVFAFAIKNYWSKRIFKGLYCLLLIIFLGAAGGPLVKIWRATEEFKQIFPILGNFESANQMVFWKAYSENAGYSAYAIRSKEIASEGDASMKLITADRSFSGVVFEPPISDWHRFRGLHLEFYNPNSEVLTIVLRIDDRDGRSCKPDTDPAPSKDRKCSRRYTKDFQLRKGWNIVEQPLSELFSSNAKSLDPSAIRWLMLYSRPSERSMTFYIDNVYLSRNMLRGKTL